MEQTAQDKKERGLVRRKILDNSGFQSKHIQVNRCADLMVRPEVQEYLYTANMEILNIDTSDHLQGRIAYFPEWVFVHVLAPRMKVRWNRSFVSQSRAAILLVKEGSIEVTSSGPVLYRRPGIYLVPSSDQPVVVRVIEPGTEFLLLSVPGSCLDTAAPDLERLAPTFTEPVPSGLLAPMYAFITGLCALSVKEVDDASPLISASREVIRTTVRVIASTGDGKEVSLYNAAMRIILNEYTDVSLCIGEVARRMRISTRTLQAAFKEEGTTVSETLREIRAAAARDLKHRQPRLTRAKLAEAVGFGSVDALDRALRLVALAKLK